MAGIGIDNGYAIKALDSVHDRLVNDFGVELLSPCYSEYQAGLGKYPAIHPVTRKMVLYSAITIPGLVLLKRD